LKKVGYDAGMHELVKRAGTEYGMKLPTNITQSPCNIDDVMTIIENPDWYKANTDSKRRIIHMLAYGMFRQGQNGWAHTAARLWLTNHNVTVGNTHDSRLNGNDYSTRQRRQLKGFAYSIIVSKVSNSIADRMSNVCRRAHGEYIAVRKNKRDIDCGYTNISLNGCDAYLVTVPNTSELDMSNRTIKLFQLNCSINEALAAGVTKQEVIEKITNIHQQLGREGKFFLTI
jgi:hypothetical protein